MSIASSTSMNNRQNVEYQSVKDVKCFISEEMASRLEQCIIAGKKNENSMDLYFQICIVKKERMKEKEKKQEAFRKRSADTSTSVTFDPEV